MGELELVFAKARFAVEFDCAMPRFSPEDALLLRGSAPSAAGGRAARAAEARGADQPGTRRRPHARS